jgi:hypothetical protein
VGILDTINQLDLSDEQKALLRREHEQEVNPLRARSRREEVDREIETLKGIGFSDAPGLLKFVRRALLSDDGEPGLVMLSDEELDLSGDEATGATGRQEITTANAIREFIKLMPRNEEGKLKIALSDQGLAGEANEPPQKDDNPDSDEKREERRKSAEGWAGRPIKRSRERYQKGGVA